MAVSTPRTARKRISASVVIRWGVLVALVAVVLLMLKRPTVSVAFVELSPDDVKTNASSFDSKLRELEAARESGGEGEVRLTNQELSAALQRSNPSEPDSLTSASPGSEHTTSAPGAEDAPEVQS